MITMIGSYLDASAGLIHSDITKKFSEGDFSEKDYNLFCNILQVFPELSNEDRSYLSFLLVSLKSYHLSSFSHLFRVMKTAQVIYNHTDDAFNEVNLHKLELAALFHDIGKLAIPLEILEKPATLTIGEYSLAQTHVDHTNTLLSFLHSDFMQEVTFIARFHHERYNSTGYPFGLKGNEIPWKSQVLGMADSIDSITSNRPYAMNMTIKDVKETFSKEIVNMEHYFEPKLYKLLFNIRVEVIQKNLVNILNSVSPEVLLREI